MVTVGRLILVADEGSEFGLGHVRRLEYLRASLEEPIKQAALLISGESYPPMGRKASDPRPFWQEVRDEIFRSRPLLCIFDLSYPKWEPIWSQFASSIPSSARIIGVDVPKESAEHFDYLIHPAISSPELAGSATWFGGPEWVLTGRKPAWRPGENGPMITVTTGSQSFESFHHWLEPKLVSLANTDIGVSWVVGRFLHDRIDELNAHNSITYCDDDNLVDRFTTSHVVLTRFGVTAYELAARGVPMVILPGWKAGEQREVDEFERLGAAVVARTRSEVPGIVREVVGDEALQRGLSLTSRRVFQVRHEHPASKLVAKIIREQTIG